MTSTSTTHVIEIESGIGEPAFVPLATGSELAPLSIGKKGMWRIESPHVLDVHAFVYFDGTSLFIQSADDSASAAVDGYAVGKAWTELHAPCRIEVGAATLVFRSLNGPRPPPLHPPEPPPPPIVEQPVFPHTADMPLDPSLGRGAVQTGPHAPQYGYPDAGRLRNDAGPPAHYGYGHDERRMRNETGPPPQYIPNDDSRSRNETGPQRQPRGFQQGPNRTADMPVYREDGLAISPMQSPGGHHVQAPPHHMTSRHAMTGPSSGSGPYASVPPMHGGYGTMTGGHPEGGIRYRDLSSAKRILLILAPFCLVAAGYLVLFDNAPASVTGRDGGTTGVAANPQPLQAPAPPPQPQPQPQLQPQPQPQLQAQPQPQPQLQPQFQPAPAIAFQQQPQPQPAPMPVQNFAQPAPAPPPSIQLVCPPGYVPYTIPLPNGTYPCVLSGTPMPPPAPAPAPTPLPPPMLTTLPAMPPTGIPVAAPPPQVDAGAVRTLERQAVDFVAMSDYAHAAAVYEQLQIQNPSNRVYAEAARILRAKANGTPPQ